MSVVNRPSRAALSRDWLDYLDALHDALLDASSQDALALRFEITIAENELVHRGLPSHALERPAPRPEWQERYEVLAWSSPEAQQLFGQALVKTGQKHVDHDLIRLGWMHQKV